MEDRVQLSPEDKKLLASFHSTMASQLNSRLSESPKFFAFVVAALTAYAYVISKSETQRFMLFLVSLISYLVLLWAIWYVAALGYAFRFLQFPMHKAEKALGWNEFGLPSGEVPKASSWCRSFWLHPGIYHAHLGGLLSIVGIVCVVFGIKWWGTQGFGYPHVEAISLAACGALLGISWAFFINNHYLEKYDVKAKPRPKEGQQKSDQ